MKNKLVFVLLSFLLSLTAGFMIQPQPPTVSQQLLDDGQWPLPTALTGHEPTLALLSSKGTGYDGNVLFEDPFPPAKFCPPECEDPK